MDILETSQRERVMTGNGRTLLDAVARQSGADPVTIAIRDHADMVYATCRRVLGNEADAADVAQETFFQFVQQAGRIRGSVGGWLHRVATRRSIDLVRQRVARRRREETYTAEAGSESPTWPEVEPLVDEAIEALSQESRELLLSHFFEGRSMAEMAAAMRTSQPTISWRVARALDELRELMRQKGVLVASGLLGEWFVEAAPAAPAAVLQSLGKMALAHSAGAATGAAGAGAMASGHKIAKLTTAGVLALGGAWWVFRPAPSELAPPPTVFATNVSFGFSTSTVWTASPGGGGIRVVTRGTNYAVTNTTAEPGARGLGAVPR